MVGGHPAHPPRTEHGSTAVPGGAAPGFPPPPPVPGRPPPRYVSHCGSGTGNFLFRLMEFPLPVDGHFFRLIEANRNAAGAGNKVRRGVASPDWQDKWVPRKPRPYDGRERKGRGLSWPRPSARAGGAGKGRGERGGGARGGGWELRTPQHGTPARSLEPPTPRRPHPTAAPLCSPLSPWLWGGGGTPTRRAPQPTQEAPHVCAPPVGFTPPTPPLSPPRTPEAPTWGAQCFPAPHVGHPPPPVGVGLAVGTLCAYGGGGGGGDPRVPPCPTVRSSFGHLLWG